MYCTYAFIFIVKYPIFNYISPSNQCASWVYPISGRPCRCNNACILQHTHTHLRTHALGHTHADAAVADTGDRQSDRKTDRWASHFRLKAASSREWGKGTWERGRERGGEHGTGPGGCPFFNTLFCLSSHGFCCRGSCLICICIWACVPGSPPATA